MALMHRFKYSINTVVMLTDKFKPKIKEHIISNMNDERLPTKFSEIDKWLNKFLNGKFTIKNMKFINNKECYFLMPEGIDLKVSDMDTFSNAYSFTEKAFELYKDNLKDWKNILRGK